MPKEFGVSNRNVDSQRFRPKVKEAISFEVASLVPATPPIGKAPGVGTGDGGAWSPNHNVFGDFYFERSNGHCCLSSG